MLKPLNIANRRRTGRKDYGNQYAEPEERELLRSGSQYPLSSLGAGDDEVGYGDSNPTEFGFETKTLPAGRLPGGECAGRDRWGGWSGLIGAFTPVFKTKSFSFLPSLAGRGFPG